MQYIYRDRYLVGNDDGIMYVFKEENYKFDKPFLFFRGKHVFMGKPKDLQTTEFSGAEDKEEFEGITPLLECEDKE